MKYFNKNFTNTEMFSWPKSFSCQSHKFLIEVSKFDEFTPRRQVSINPLLDKISRFCTEITNYPLNCIVSRSSPYGQWRKQKFAFERLLSGNLCSFQCDMFIIGNRVQNSRRFKWVGRGGRKGGGQEGMRQQDNLLTLV